MHKNYLFTSESVTGGHSDKVCDQISDANFNAFPEQYTTSKVTRKTVISSGIIFAIIKEITNSSKLNIENIVKQTLKNIGYTRAKYGINSKSRTIYTYIYSQSLYIVHGNDRSLTNKLGIYRDTFNTDTWDHVIMLEFAYNKAVGCMLLAIFPVHILPKCTEVKNTGVLPYLCSDGKSQVTVKYLNDKPAQIKTAFYAQSKPNILQSKNTCDIYRKNILLYIMITSFDRKTKIFVNLVVHFESSTIYSFRHFIKISKAAFV